MTKLLTSTVFVLVLLLCLASLQQATANTVETVSFPVGKKYTYNYISNIHTFGGEIEKTEGENIIAQDDKQSKDGEKSKISAQVQLECVQHWKKANEKTTYLLHMKITNVKMDMSLDAQDGWATKQEEKTTEAEQKDLKEVDKKFGLFTALTMSSNGKIYHIYHHKNEESWVTSLKKSIVGQLQVKFTGEERLEVGGVGNHTSHYQKSARADGLVQVSRSYTDRDIQEPVDENVDEHKELRLNSNTDVTVNPKTGAILGSKKHTSVNLGTHTRTPAEPFFAERNIPYEEKYSTSAGKSMWLNADEQSELTFVKEEQVAATSAKVNPDTLLFPVQAMVDDQVLVDGLPEFNIHPDIIASTLEPKGMHDHLKKIRLDRLKEKYNFGDLLQQLRQDPDDVIVAALARQFLELEAEYVEDVIALFNKTVSEKTDSILSDNGDDEADEANVNKENALKLLQSLLISSSSPKAQDYFLSTFTSKGLIDHGILRSLQIKKPSPQVVDKLKNLARKVQQSDKPVTSIEDTTALNAFLALADAASRVPKEQGKEIVNMIIDKLFSNSFTNSTGPSIHNEIVFFLNALGNAGSRTPLALLRLFIEKSSIPDSVKQVAIYALRKRFEDNEAVNELMEDILLSDNLADELKSEAIAVQLKRQEKLRNHEATFPALRKLHKTKPLSRNLKKSVLQYLYMTNDKAFNQAYKEHFKQDDIDVDQMLSDAEFLGKVFKKVGKAIGNAAKSVGKAVSGAAKAVGNAAKTVAKGVVNGVKAVGGAVSNVANKVKNAFDDIKKVFTKATFEGQKVCLPSSANPSDAPICLYDNSMLEFVNQLGDLSVYGKSYHFELEKLLGSNKIHAYVGVVGYVGANLDCLGVPTPGAELELLIAGRANLRANIFSKKFNLLEAQLKLQRGAQGYDDLMYLSVLGAVIIQGKILDPAKYCKLQEKKLYEKDFPNLPSFSFTIMLGPIPVSLGFSMSAKMQVHSVVSYCLVDLTAKAGIRPSFEVGVSGHAAISIFVAKAGLELKMKMNYGVLPNIELKGKQCQICANLDHSVKPLSLYVNAFADINLFVWKKKAEKTLFKWESPGENGTIIQKCLTLGRNRKD